MRNKLIYFLSIVSLLFSSASGMLQASQQLAITSLCSDLKNKIQNHCDLQSVGRFATTCKSFDAEFNLKIFFVNKKCEDFEMVEKFLYAHMPKLIVAEKSEVRTQFKKLLLTVTDAYVDKIDTKITDIYEIVKLNTKLKGADFDSFFVDSLTLTPKDRRRFYLGQLSGVADQFSCWPEELLSCDTSAYDVIHDLVEAAAEDAITAIDNKDIARLHVLMDRFEQFETAKENLLHPLCQLGDSSLVINFLIRSSRGVDYRQLPDNKRAIDYAVECKNDLLIASLLGHGSSL